MTPEMVEQIFDCYEKLRLTSVNDLCEGVLCLEAQNGCDEVDGKASVLYLEAQSGGYEVDGISQKQSKQEKVILEIAQKLVKLSEDFEKAHHTRIEALVHGTKGTIIEDVGTEGQNQFSCVNLVPSYLSANVTPETFKETLHTVCKHATSVPLEFALALEISTQLYRNYGASVGFIPNVVAEYFQSRIDIEDLQNM